MLTQQNSYSISHLLGSTVTVQWLCLVGDLWNRRFAVYSKETKRFNVLHLISCCLFIAIIIFYTYLAYRYLLEQEKKQHMSHFLYKT